MSSNKPKTKRIGKHHFRLIGKDTLYFKGEHIASFAPLPKNKMNQNRSIMPTFNHDRKYYTYAFHLPSSPIEKDHLVLEQHQKRAAQSLLQLSEMLVPKPRSRHKYCGVCRSHYQDYKDHIESQLHVNNLKKSQYQTFINQLCHHYQSNLERKQPEQIKIVDLTSEEGLFKIISELVETTSTSRGVLT